MRGDDQKTEADDLRVRLGKELREIFADVEAAPMPRRLASLVPPPDEPPLAGGASARPIHVEYYDEDIGAGDRRATRG
jgi:hypothetical protein